ncbi:winged helix-turn-helix transcriptional regulator [Halogeometricum sp. S1BR25-6]|uniref:Winged helix-turn-helix transcriptional regulator n=1 Tax=Halogeometricum salsisoli TaxID=2950536 RepID=A0ABU2GAH0_9EURY|nr:winged helix-turn-helix transcriptional regulator [Halogeometricum sp. S1BR25-6]MDS0297813.1 winged helix-turn-helix transcriptional regulator [Halogeometricum sp. S1BR25-6]
MSDREPPLRAVLDGATVVGKKWHPAVVYSLVAEGPAGFSELERRLDVSSKVLNETLADLTESGVVERRELQERPLRVEYAPTEAGNSLADVLFDLGRWSERYRAEGAPVVLVVDDDARLTELYASMLEGYEVRAANDGREGLSMVDETVDVVLLDRKMPEVAGERVARRIAEEYPSVRVVLLASDRLDEAALTVPFDRYLRKPVTATGLTETVEDLLTPREETVRRYLSTLAKTAAFNGDTNVDAYRKLTRRRDELAEELQDPEGIAAAAGLGAEE